MPDTLTRFALVGDLNNRHMAPVADGNYVLYLDYRAYIDALTAHAKELHAKSEFDYVPCPICEELHDA